MYMSLAFMNLTLMNLSVRLQTKFGVCECACSIPNPEYMVVGYGVCSHMSTVQCIVCMHIYNTLMYNSCMVYGLLHRSKVSGSKMS